MAMPETAARGAKPTRVRYLMLLLIFVATVLNYLDRTNLSVAAPLLTRELKLSPAQMGYLFSAFAWTYAVFNLPAGYLVDRFGSRLTYALSLFLWSAATAVQGLAGSFTGLFGLRLGVGVAEAPAFPSNNRVVTVWFPTRERGMATGTFVSGQYIGTGLCTPILFWIAASFGWRPIFYATGLAGIAFAFIWWLAYRDPHESRAANAAEIAEMREGGALLDGGVRNVFRWSEVWQLFEHRQLWAICLGKFAISVSIFFLLTWFPSFLIQERHLSVLKAGYYAMAPYLAAALGVLTGGAWSDWLLRRGWSLASARKTPIITGFLLTSCIFLANYTTSNLATIAVISLAFFAQGVSSMGWAVTSEVAPAKLVGVTGGIVNFFANLAGIATPIAIGYIVGGTGSYYGALALVGAAGLLGVFAYTVVLGDLRRIELRPT